MYKQDHKNHFAVIALFTVFTAFVLGGCGKKTESWAYIHEPSKEILALYDNNKAEYKGEEYNYSKDDAYILLKDKSGEETKYRYIPDGDKMIFYETSTYKRDASTPGKGIVGLWTQDNGWLYQFTEQGTFSEENIFYGHYAVDEDAHTIKLMYDDPIEDAILYYSLDGDELTIDYPWPMVHTESGKK